MTPEIESLCSEIAETLLRGISEDAKKAWVYAELPEHGGAVAVYQQMTDGLVRALTRRSDAGLERALFSQLLELRRLWAATTGRPWTVASHAWEHPRLSIQFGYEDVTDARSAPARRERWEQRQFGDRGVEPRDGRDARPGSRRSRADLPRRREEAGDSCLP